MKKSGKKDIKGIEIKEGDTVYAQLNDTTYVVRYGDYLAEIDAKIHKGFFIARKFEEEEEYEDLTESEKYLEIVKPK